MYLISCTSPWDSTMNKRLCLNWSRKAEFWLQKVLKNSPLKNIIFLKMNLFAAKALNKGSKSLKKCFWDKVQGSNYALIKNLTKKRPNFQCTFHQLLLEFHDCLCLLRQVIVFVWANINPLRPLQGAFSLMPLRQSS